MKQNSVNIDECMTMIDMQKNRIDMHIYNAWPHFTQII